MIMWYGLVVYDCGMEQLYMIMRYGVVVYDYVVWSSCI